MTKQTIINALRAFLESRPGFEPANYAGAPQAYRADYRRAYQHLQDGRALLRACEWRDTIDADSIARAKHYRIQFVSSSVDYCTGQYYPTEYRAAVCHTLSTALWNYWRDHCGCDTAAKIRDMARRELGRSIARRWFGA